MPIDPVPRYGPPAPSAKASVGQKVVNPIKKLRTRFIACTSFTRVHCFTSLEQQNALVVLRTTRASMCTRPTQFQKIGPRYPGFIADLLGSMESFNMLAFFYEDVNHGGRAAGPLL